VTAHRNLTNVRTPFWHEMRCTNTRDCHSEHVFSTALFHRHPAFCAEHREHIRHCCRHSSRWLNVNLTYILLILCLLAGPVSLWLATLALVDLTLTTNQGPAKQSDTHNRNAILRRGPTLMKSRRAISVAM
jgi:hypothetical protein